MTVLVNSNNRRQNADCNVRIKENIPISSLTTMRLGGAARYLAEIQSLDDCVCALKFAATRGFPVYVLGGGSNVIGRDEGFEGVVLLNKIGGIEVVNESENEIVIKAASGEEMDALANLTAKRGWSGLEALSAIPGTVGGAVVQNAGAYGQEIADVLESIKAFDMRVRRVEVLRRNQLDMSYRSSVFNSAAKGRYFILSITLRLNKHEIEGELFSSLESYLAARCIADRSPATIRDAVIAIRTQKLPDPAIEANCGSFFKNLTIHENECETLRKAYPDIPIFLSGNSSRISSGWLIEQCGFKGQLLHGMRISNQSALILINESARSYRDLAAARAVILATVQERFGFTLEQEPEELRAE